MTSTARDIIVPIIQLEKTCVGVPHFRQTSFSVPKNKILVSNLVIRYDQILGRKKKLQNASNNHVTFFPGF